MNAMLKIDYLNEICYNIKIYTFSKNLLRKIYILSFMHKKMSYIEYRLSLNQHKEATQEGGVRCII